MEFQAPVTWHTGPATSPSNGLTDDDLDDLNGNDNLVDVDGLMRDEVGEDDEPSQGPAELVGTAFI